MTYLFLFLTGLFLGASIAKLLMDRYVVQPLQESARELILGWAETLKQHAQLLLKYNDLRLNTPRKSPIQMQD